MGAGDDPRQQCRRRPWRAHHRGDARGLAEGARHGSRRALLHRPGVRPPADRGRRRAALSSISPRSMGCASTRASPRMPPPRRGSIQLTQALALDWARYDIRVNAIAPGWFPTGDESPTSSSSEAGEAIREANPMRRFGKEGDLDGALLLLASDAGAYHDRGGDPGRRRTGALAHGLHAFPRDRGLSPRGSPPSSPMRSCRSRATRRAINEFENIRLDLRDRCAPRPGRQDLWAPQMPTARGGLGLPMVGQAAFYEAANRSIFGPCCFNCAAPDDGNMRLLTRSRARTRRSAGCSRSSTARSTPPSP